MKYLKSALLLALSFTLLSPVALIAEEVSSIDKESATVIFVRGAETAKTRSLKYNVYIGEEYVGRMKVKDRKEIQMPAGDYRVMSNFYRGTAMNVSLEPGKIYVISTAMENKVNRKETSFKLVSENIVSSEDVVINTDS
jgi:hypothetical protein